MATAALETALIEEALRRLPGWRHEGQALVRVLVFADFREAFAFMTRVAFEAEALDHHPDWANAYRTVTIRLTTHDAGHRVTARDLALAERIQALVPTTGR